MSKKDQKKVLVKKNRKSTDFRSFNSRFSSSNKNKDYINILLEKKIKSKKSSHQLLNKNNILKNKKIDDNSLIKEDKLKIKNNKSVYQINNNSINQKKIVLPKNIRKNKKKSNLFTSSRFDKFIGGSSNRKFKEYKKKSSILQQKFHKPLKAFSKPIIIRNKISVSDLSNKMAVKSSKVIKELLLLGVSVTKNQILDQDTAQLVAEEMGHQVSICRDDELEISMMKDRDLGDSIEKIRPPIVTMMGHVDHGKTSLLDYIRSTKTVDREKGGITQHIGAYHVRTSQGVVTFLDTPGHAAFTSMRARGTRITDIVVLVIAADDGIMPQTIEAIKHAQNAKVPIIVAINKIDKTDANTNKIQKELLKYSIISENFGGENIFVSVSAKTGYGIDNLLSSILLQSEILELKSVYNRMASGVVIESFLDSKRGPVASVLIYQGTLRVNDVVICGLEYGKIKLLKDEFQKNIFFVEPSIPVEIFGLSGVPKAGDLLKVVRSEKQAKEVSLYRKKKFREIRLLSHKRVHIDDLFTHLESKKTSELNIILKADVQGSLEAILDALRLISNQDIKVHVVISGVGAITETDASLSITTSSVLIGFNVRANSSSKKIIEEENLDIRYYSIIYDLINDVKSLVSGLVVPVNNHKIIGLAEVRDVFKSPKFGLIAGCMVIEGVIKKTCPIRVLRNNIVIYEGELESLRRFKEDVTEVRNGIECGIGVKNYTDVRTGDIIELFQIFK
ncbi:translation initiation factor IF-2 [Buchnera aphidicola]|uniref:Translation initiation factor IF-2 n=1 Tax=Buchnera aphidicola (Cinara strobi) TaxID=1921549 RepID=A0A3B1E0S8_9GAMM|nr:translation initiation factor IF-2 [Buchnera aphidicola]VAX76625.1 Translation initiation factor IF-2, isoform beta [Buchnera aphidicola (Cinara strobi)]